MECNRDEALRAKEVAEKKIASADFTSARKYVELAQRLFPGLDGLPQVVAVIDVQAVAQERVGSDSNWYGILQVEPTADDAVIKKQYRKLALLLHPDKNKGVGAEAAFKIIGEALAVLSDKTRRAAFDLRRKSATARKVANGPAPGGGRAKTNNPHPQPPQQPAFANSHQTGHAHPATQNASGAFYITCPYCGDVSGCLVTNRNKPVQCVRCRKYYIAVDMAAQAQEAPGAAYAGYNQQQSAFFYRSQSGSSWPSQQAGAGTGAGAGMAVDSGGGFAGQTAANGTGEFVQNVWNTVQKQKAEEAERKRQEKEAKRKEREEIKRKAREEEEHRRREERERREKEKLEQVAKTRAAKEAKEAARKRDLETLKNKRKVLEEKADSRKKDDGKQKAHKRIKRSRVDLEDDDEDIDLCLEDDDVDHAPKENLKKAGLDASHNGMGPVRRSMRNRAKVSYRVDDSSDGEDGEPKVENGHGMGKAAAAAVAGKSSLQAGPNNRVNGGEESSPQEEQPTSTAGNPTVKNDRGESLEASATIAKDSVPSHSHHKNTSPQQQQPHTPPQSQQSSPLKQKFMQQQQEKSLPAEDGLEQEIERLVKKQKKMGPTGEGSTIASVGKKEISLAELNGLRYQQTAGATATSQHVFPEQPQTGCTLSCPPKVLEEETDSSTLSRDKAGTNSELHMEVPDPDFHIFDQERLEEHIQSSQIWALYDEVDGMPRYYARISQVNRGAKFTCHASWFETKTDIKRFSATNCISAGCGEFTIGSSKKHNSIGVFSHRVSPTRVSSDKRQYSIYPLKGEVWALYKQEWLLSVRGIRTDAREDDSQSGKKITYEMVVVVGDYSDSIGVEVCYLSKVSGFRTIFQRNLERSRVKFLPTEIVKRFSHKVPHHQCTGSESPGVPPGAWELDPAATPIDLILPSEASHR